MGGAKRLEAGGKPFRIMAGPNGSIQGPAEAKWGYTTLSVADWDGDGLPDIVFNSIWGRVEWLRNVGTRGQPRLAAAARVEVEWPGTPPKPAWTWWTPRAERARHPMANHTRRVRLQRRRPARSGDAR